MFVALLPTLKIFLFVEINLEVIEVVARSCSFKKNCQNFENLTRNTSLWVSFLKNKTKREKKETLAQVLFREFCQFFQNFYFEGCQWMAVSEVNICGGVPL